MQETEAQRHDHYLTTQAGEAVARVELQGELKPLFTFNDWVLVLQDELDTDIALAGDSGRLPEGVVVGIPGPGHGVPDGAGGRLPSQLTRGDRVKFYERAVVEQIKPRAGYYAGRTLVVIAEKNVLFRLSETGPVADSQE